MQKIFVKTAVRGYSVLRAFGVCTHTLSRVRYHPAPNKKMQKKSVRTTDFFNIGYGGFEPPTPNSRS